MRPYFKFCLSHNLIQENTRPEKNVGIFFNLVTIRFLVTQLDKMNGMKKIGSQTNQPLRIDSGMPVICDNSAGFEKANFACLPLIGAPK